MLEVLLLMLATGVQSAAALDGPSGSTAMTPAIEAPVVATAPTPRPEPAPAPVVESLAEEDPPETTQAPQQTSALGLPMFPPASAAPVPAQPIPSFPPVASTAPTTPAPVVTAPQPTPQPVIAIPTPQPLQPPQPAPQPVIAMPQPTTPAPSGQLAFLAPKTTAAPVSPGLVAEPQVPTGRFLTALEVRPILNATKGNWIAVREYAGKDLLYVTHLWSWRCGLAELKIGLNGGAPEVWPLPPCHPEQAQAAAILEGDGNPYREFGLRSVQLIEVVLTYDDLTTDRVRFNRGGVVIP